MLANETIQRLTRRKFSHIVNAVKRCYLLCLCSVKPNERRAHMKQKRVEHEMKNEQIENEVMIANGKNKIE